jgi:hypothetical protein
MSTKQEFKREAEEAAEKLDEASEAARDYAEEAAEEARRAAAAYAAEAKRTAVTTIEDYAAAIRKASEELGTRNHPFGANLTGGAADNLEHVAHDVETTTMADFADSVHRFARRNPAALLVGSVLAGVALGRFAKASSDRVREEERRGGAERAVPAPRPVVGPANTARK